MEQDVHIEEYSKKGWGIATLSSGKSVEVAHTVVGDTVRIACKSRKKGRLLEVLSPGKQRVLPTCSHASICGGCVWQQMSYPAQLEHKQKWIQELFSSFSTAEIYPIHPAKQIFRYRNKMEFSFGENAGGQKYLGLMIAGSGRYVFTIDHCYLVSPWFSQLLEKVRAWFIEEETAFTSRNWEGNLRTLTVREATNTNQRLVMLTANHPINEASFVKAVEAFSSNIVFRQQKAEKNTTTQFYEKTLMGNSYIWEKMSVLDRTFMFKISATAFFQPNIQQAKVLYEKVLSYIEKGECVCDLYAGTGTISCIVATKAKSVFAIENNLAAVENAKENFVKNGIDNVSIYAEDVGENSHALPLIDTVIVDPPRAGLDTKAFLFIQKIAPKKIVYVSCNPWTQKNDITLFTNHGYKLVEIQPVDQFPHTYHIENIAYLQKK